MILKFLQIVMQRMVFHTLFVTNMVLKTSLLSVQLRQQIKYLNEISADLLV